MTKFRLRKYKKGNAFSENEDINPMNYTGNMSDAMLVLAVGIMLALVMAFKLNISDLNAGGASNGAEIEEIEEEMEPLHVTTDEESMTIDEYGLEEFGTVYRDQDGNLYVIEG